LNAAASISGFAAAEQTKPLVPKAAWTSALLTSPPHARL